MLHTDNKELGLLTIKSAVGYPDILMTHFILDIQVKDGRYKYDLHHMVMKYGRYLPDTPDKTYEEYIKTSGTSWVKGVNADFGNIIKSLKDKMDDVEEDW